MKGLIAAAIIMTITTAGLAQTVVDPDLIVDNYARGFDNPTGIAFLNGAGDALVTQKNDGRVLFLHNRKITSTALDLPVANDSERGLLSIALSPAFATDHQVYLYHTVATKDGGAATSNRIDRWTWNGSRLTFNRTIMDLPATPGPNHDGGKILFDGKGKLFAVVGDLNQTGRTQNFEGSNSFTQTSVIIRVQPDGRAISTNPFAGVSGAQNIYAYGVRNSFGLAVDPVTNNLWDTENGQNSFDEINQVSPGSNSGWRDIMGPTSRNGGSTGTLVNISSRAFYSEPEFSWATPVAPTDLHFFNGPQMGEQYRNDLFVGDVNTGSLFHFDLTANRRALALSGSLADLVADNDTSNRLAEQNSILFGDGFGATSDILSGPGGMFVLSLTNGRLYRIRENPAASSIVPLFSISQVPEPSAAAALLLIYSLTSTRRQSGSASRKIRP
ncbi:MAG TPA: PQQ-dependent sugar dehydrogenase [Tepidisphaeraceae bacterium]|nr:PQQ-dependent sugar dehydrogenase [Tepidisphaeraceae bacterium]